MTDPDKLRLFEILAHEHEPMLMAYILSLISDPVLAEDIAQQTFLIAFRKISTLRKPESFPAWLRGIARREVFSALRGRQMEVPLDPGVLDAMENAFQALEDPCIAWRAESGAGPDGSRAAQVSPHVYAYPLALADAARERGHGEAALQRYQKALELAPDHPVVLSRLGDLYRDLFQDADRAEELYRRAIQADPARPEGYSSMGTLRLMQGHFIEAEQHLRQAADLEPGNPQILNSLGEALRHQNKLGEATGAYQMARRIGGH